MHAALPCSNITMPMTIPDDMFSGCYTMHHLCALLFTPLQIKSTCINQRTMLCATLRHHSTFFADHTRVTTHYYHSYPICMHTAPCGTRECSWTSPYTFWIPPPWEVSPTLIHVHLYIQSTDLCSNDPAVLWITWIFNRHRCTNKFLPLYKSANNVVCNIAFHTDAHISVLNPNICACKNDVHYV